MKMRRLLRLEAIATLVVLVAPGASWAQEERFNVKAFRTDRVDLYDCGVDKRKTGQELTKAGFSGPLPATREPSSPLYLRVHVNGQQYCVRAFAVQTDKVITVPDKECGTRVAGKQVSTGATRGVGEGCGR
jgi:hypothetical protein